MGKENLKITLNVALLILHFSLSFSVILRLLLYFYDHFVPQSLLLLPLLLVGIITFLVTIVFSGSYLNFRLQRSHNRRFTNAYQLIRLNRRLITINFLTALFIWPIFLIVFTL